jgi:hypothetical protein
MTRCGGPQPPACSCPSVKPYVKPTNRSHTSAPAGVHPNCQRRSGCPAVVRDPGGHPPVQERWRAEGKEETLVRKQQADACVSACLGPRTPCATWASSYQTLARLDLEKRRLTPEPLMVWHTRYHRSTLGLVLPPLWLHHLPIAGSRPRPSALDRPHRQWLCQPGAALRVDAAHPRRHPVGQDQCDVRRARCASHLSRRTNPGTAGTLSRRGKRALENARESEMDRSGNSHEATRWDSLNPHSLSLRFIRP